MVLGYVQCTCIEYVTKTINRFNQYLCIYHVLFYLFYQYCYCSQMVDTNGYTGVFLHYTLIPYTYIIGKMTQKNVVVNCVFTYNVFRDIQRGTDIFVRKTKQNTIKALPCVHWPWLLYKVKCYCIVYL